MTYSPQYGQQFQSLTQGVLGFFGMVLAFIIFIGLSFAVLTYVFEAISLYSIAKRRGIHNRWVAWIPVFNGWLLGGISDQYQYFAKGESTSRRKILLGLDIALVCLWIFAGVLRVLTAAGALFGATAVGALIALMAICVFSACVVSIVDAVFRYICLYDLFASCNPDSALLFLLLSLLVNVTFPFLLFVSRNKDEGMPARAASGQKDDYVPPEQPETSYEEPPIYTP